MKADAVIYTQYTGAYRGTSENSEKRGFRVEVVCDSQPPTLFVLSRTGSLYQS